MVQPGSDELMENKEILEMPEITALRDQRPVQLQDPELAKVLKGEETEETGMSEAILEGLLFIVGDEGLTVDQASQTLEISQERVNALFDSLQKKYLDDAYGIEIANYGGVYRFLSKAVVHPYAKKLFQLGKQNTLSQAALETLAIIAYRQPVTRVEIEEIRGVSADMMLRKLEARDLIRVSGRSEAPGRPMLYEVTETFMDSFKLLSLDELPELPVFDNEESDDLFEQ